MRNLLIALLIIAAVVLAFQLGQCSIDSNERGKEPRLIERQHLDLTPDRAATPTTIEYVLPRGVVSDTVIIEVSEPVAELAADSNLVLSSRSPIEVRRPLFGANTVRWTYYDPVSGETRRETFDASEHPFKYGIEARAYADLEPHGLIPSPGVEANVYAGYKALQFTVGGVIDQNGPGARVGVRVRLGR